MICPIEDDPAHALNRAWTTLQADPATARVTHVVAFGGSRPVIAGPVYAAWLGVPLVTLIRGNDFDAAVFSARRRPILDDALTRSAVVCAVSQDKVDKIAALHPGVRVRRIPNGIDRTDWALAPSDERRAAAWRGETVPDGVQTIGLFGQLKAKKGGVLLLEALARSGTAERFHLLLAGWLEPDMDAWLREHDGAISYTLLPFLDRYELLPWYAACDWIAIPSFYDGLPNVLMEAAALGIPLIASRAGGMADVLRDDSSGLLFEPGDEVGCAAALQRAALMPPSERARLGNACRDARRVRTQRRARVLPLHRRAPRGALPTAMVLLYSLGGGLGHLTRARCVLGALGLEREAAILTASRYARDPRVTGAVPVIEVPRRLGHDRAAFRRWLAATLREVAPDELIVDSFPGGILGELCGLELPPARLVARHLRWPAYRRRLAGPLPHYETAYLIEPLATPHVDAVGAIAKRLESLPLTLPGAPVARPARGHGRRAAARRAAHCGRPFRPGGGAG